MTDDELLDPIAQEIFSASSLRQAFGRDGFLDTLVESIPDGELSSVKYSGNTANEPELVGILEEYLGLDHDQAMKTAGFNRSGSNLTRLQKLEQSAWWPTIVEKCCRDIEEGDPTALSEFVVSLAAEDRVAAHVDARIVL